MWKKLTAVDTYDNRTDLWINPEAKVLAVKAIGSSISTLIFEGGAEVRVAGTAEELAVILSETDESTPAPAGDGD